MIDWSYSFNESINLQYITHFRNKFYDFKNNLYNIDSIDLDMKNHHDSEYKSRLRKFRKHAIEMNKE